MRVCHHICTLSRFKDGVVSRRSIAIYEDPNSGVHCTSVSGFPGDDGPRRQHVKAAESKHDCMSAFDTFISNRLADGYTVVPAELAYTGMRLGIDAFDDLAHVPLSHRDPPAAPPFVARSTVAIHVRSGRTAFFFHDIHHTATESDATAVAAMGLGAKLASPLTSTPP